MAERHFGRKTPQPSRRELRAYYLEAEQVLSHPVIWFDETHRQAIAEAFGQVIERERLTCYACAALRSHVHLLIRKHKLTGERMLETFKDSARRKLREAGLVAAGHPVFSADLFQAFKSDTQAVRNCITYIQEHFRKHKLPAAKYLFVTPYNDWPFHKASESAGSG